MSQRIDLEATSTEEPRAVGMVVNRPEGGTGLRIAPRSDVSAAG